MKQFWNHVLPSSTAELDAVFDILMGQGQFIPASKNLYDFGLVCKVSSSSSSGVVPVSDLARSVLLDTYSHKFNGKLYPVTSAIEDGHHIQAGIKFSL